MRFDPETETFQSWAIPSGIGIIRHVWVTQNKDLLIHQSSSNRIGRIKVIEDQTEVVTVEETDTAGG